MSQNGFVMVLVEPASGAVTTTVRFGNAPPTSDARLDLQCPLFGDWAQPGNLRIIRCAPPPVVWVNDLGEAYDVFHRAPWPLHIHDPKPGIWVTRFADPKTPDGKLHLCLDRSLNSDREMVQTAWRLPEKGATPFPGEEGEYRETLSNHLDTVRSLRDINALRKDLSKKPVFTIDNDDSRDLDDALDIYLAGKDKYIVGIHIADVTAFVRPNSPRDNDARQRGTSHYFDDTVHHMLPECLSTDLCSLSPEKDKLAVSLYFDIALNRGEAVIRGSRIFNSVIRSRHQLTYSGVDKALDGATSNIPKDILQALRDAVSIGVSLRTGRPDNLSDPNDHGTSGAMIEDFMVTTNQIVGEHMTRTLRTMKNAKNCCMFRSHPGPSVDNLLSLADRLATIDLMDPFNPKALLEAARIRQKKEFPSRKGREKAAFRSAALHREIRSRLRMDSDAAVSRLRTLESGPGGLKIWKAARLSNAFYLSGHHSLGISRYAWFTSPIRRYPDMVNHRFLKSTLYGKSSAKALLKVDAESLHRLIADGRAAQRAHRQRRDFHLMFEIVKKDPNKKISVQPLNFRWFSPYTFVVEVEVSGFEVQIQVRDPEHVHIENHGLQCRVTIPGEFDRLLRIGRPVELDLAPGDMSPEAGRMFINAAQWLV